MSTIYLLPALFLVLNLVAGLIRIVMGPSAFDRMLSAQLFGTTGVAVLLLLSYAFENPALLDVALVFALLAVIASVVFVRRVKQPPRASAEGP